MPRADEFAKLRDAVDTVWTDNYNNSGVAGLLCTDKNDKTKTLFFPACGYAKQSSIEDVCSNGYYWSKSLYDEITAYHLSFYSDNVNWQDTYNSYYGYTVRGVWDDKLTKSNQ